MKYPLGVPPTPNVWLLEPDRRRRDPTAVPTRRLAAHLATQPRHDPYLQHLKCRAPEDYSRWT